MEKAVVYSMSRSYGYHRVIPSLNSMLKNGGIDEAYLLTEDDDVGFDLPECVHVLNMSGQQYFKVGGPNYDNGWTYMSLLQAALPMIFSKKEKILCIDGDTIVTHDISDLWDIPLDRYYLAGVPEPYKTKKYGYLYVNCGVVLFNLAKLRNDHKADDIIQSLNVRRWDFTNQDCINELCCGSIYALPAKYNANFWTGIPDEYWIRHFAAEGNGWYDNEEIVQQYKNGIIQWNKK